MGSDLYEKAFDKPCFMSQEVGKKMALPGKNNFIRQLGSVVKNINSGVNLKGFYISSITH